MIFFDSYCFTKFVVKRALGKFVRTKTRLILVKITID